MYWVMVSVNRMYRVMVSANRMYWVMVSVNRMCRVMVSANRMYRVMVSGNRMYRAMTPTRLQTNVVSCPVSFVEPPPAGWLALCCVVVNTAGWLAGWPCAVWW